MAGGVKFDSLDDFARMARAVKRVEAMPRDQSAAPNAARTVFSAAIPVKLINPTGSAGTNAPPAAATFTYDVQTPDGSITIATAVAVWMARQLGHVTAATHGYAQRIGGTWFIVAHDEVIDATSCG